MNLYIFLFGRFGFIFCNQIFCTLTPSIHANLFLSRKNCFGMLHKSTWKWVFTLCIMYDCGSWNWTLELTFYGCIFFYLSNWSLCLLIKPQKFSRKTETEIDTWRVGFFFWIPVELKIVAVFTFVTAVFA